MSDLGEVVPLGVVVRDENKVPVDAETVELTITLPDGSTYQPVVLNPPTETGRYAVDYVPREQAGLYSYRWVSTRPDLVLEASFHVERPGTVGVLSLAEAKDYLNMREDDRHDEEIMRAMRSATALAEDARHEVILRRTITETSDLGRYPVPGHALVHGPVLALTSVQRLQGGAVVETLAPPAVWVDEHGVVRAGRLAALHGLCRFTYTAGYAVVPEEFREAVGYILQAVWSARRGSNSRPRVPGSEDQQSPRSEMPSVPGRALDLLGVSGRGPLVG